MIQTTQLSSAYDTFVLPKISFSCETNLTILGANGVGKSTLAKALCGLIPFEGTVTLHHQDLQSFSTTERAKMITYIPPKLISFDTFISVEDFVLMGRFAHKSPLQDYTQSDRDIVQKLLQERHINPKQTLNTLSSGQQQLVLIAQALAQESNILIFDEPTANLDPKHAYDFFHLLKALPKAHQQLLITHDIALAKALAYPVLFLDEEGAHFYPQANDFFTPENLTQCYHAPFELLEQHVGVNYE